MLTEAFLISRVPRYDIRGRALLATDEKHYLGDHGIVHALFGYSDRRLPAPRPVECAGDEEREPGSRARSASLMADPGTWRSLPPGELEEVPW